MTNRANLLWTRFHPFHYTTFKSSPIKQIAWVLKHTNQLRGRLAQPKTVFVSGPFDALSAKIPVQVGCQITCRMGLGLTADVIRMPEVGLLTMTEMVNHGLNIVNAIGFPLISDVDNG